MIIVGIRSDLAGKAARAQIAVSGMARTVRDVIGTNRRTPRLAIRTGLWSRIVLG